MKKIKTTTYNPKDYSLPKEVYNFPVIIEKDEDGFFVADCPDIAGCHTQGRSLEEAITNIRDAIKLNLKVMKSEKQEIPRTQPVSLTSIEVSI